MWEKLIHKQIMKFPGHLLQSMLWNVLAMMTRNYSLLYLCSSYTTPQLFNWAELLHISIRLCKVFLKLLTATWSMSFCSSYAIFLITYLLVKAMLTPHGDWEHFLKKHIVCLRKWDLLKCRKIRWISYKHTWILKRMI